MALAPSGPAMLYLLHGLSDDRAAWTRYRPVQRYADEAAHEWGLWDTEIREVIAWLVSTT